MKTIGSADGRYAWTVKVGDKGQFVIPKEARDAFDIKPGDSLLLLGDVKRGLAIPPKEVTMRIADDIMNSIHKEDKK